MKSKWIALSMAIAVMIIVFLAGRWSGAADGDTEHLTEAGEDGGEVVWTCSMHPQVRQPGPGACTICGMDLIPVSSDDDPADDSELPRLAVSARSAALMDVQTWPAQRKGVELQKPLLGRVLYDETRTYDVVVRTDSYIERLFTNYMGAPVSEGDHLAELYSPDIFAAAEDLLIGARMGENAGEALSRDGRQRLRLLGVSDREIDRILETGEAPQTFTVYSPHTGIINEMGGHQGHWLSEGQHLVEIVDTSSMWVWLDVYERDMPFIHHGQPIRFTTRSLPGREFTGSVAFVPPNIDRESRAFRVRVNVPNPDGALRDGMFVNAVLNASVDARGGAVPPDMEGIWLSPMHPEIVSDGPGECTICGMDLVPAEQLGLVRGEHYEPPLVIPASAALITGRRAVVYVKLPDMDRPTYEFRQVDLGPKTGEYYVVFSGLDEGEQVVTNGNFKIDSELQLRGRPSMMAPPQPREEVPPMIDPAHPALALSADDVPQEVGERADRLVRSYLELGRALADDDFSASRQALMEVHDHTGAIDAMELPEPVGRAWTSLSGRLHAPVHAMAEADDLDGIRAHLEPLTDQVELVLRSLATGELNGIYRAHCPMAFDDEGADWLQQDEEIANPYFGASMFRCGETVRPVIAANEPAATPIGERGSEE